MNWKDLTALTGGTLFSVERVRLQASGIALEGSFEPPLVAQLPFEDQLFIMAFVRSHGSIKEMERLFGVSYPTIKARLNRLAEQLGPALAVEEVSSPPGTVHERRRAILDRVGCGDLSVEEALDELAR